MKNLVRIVEKDDRKVVLWYREWFDSRQELETRKPTRQGIAKENSPVHDRFNDSDDEAERYFEKFCSH
jgi:hypothetical protein